MKKIISILLGVMLLCGSIPALAATPPDNQVSPLYVHISNAKCTMSISGNTATCTGTASADKSNYTVKGTLRLQKQNGTSWTTVSTWTDEGTGLIGIDMNKSKSGLANGTYRAYLYVRIYNSNDILVESANIYSGTKTINL